MTPPESHESSYCLEHYGGFIGQRRKEAVEQRRKEAVEAKEKPDVEHTINPAKRDIEQTPKPLNKAKSQ